MKPVRQAAPSNFDFHQSRNQVFTRSPSGMATLPGARSTRGGSNSELGALPKPPGRSARPASTRRAAAVAEVAAADVLTAEEEYLLKIFRRYRKHAPPSPATKAPSSDGKAPPPNRRSPSPVPDRSKAALSARGGLGAVGTAGVDKKVDQKSSPGGEKTLAKPEQRPAPPAPKTDVLSRTKMILEQKRKAAAAGFSRAGSAASAGAGVQRKAKISKAAGGQSSAASARLDPVKYPTSGLLLKQEFRTFEEGEEDGERAFTPVEPLVRDLTNFGLADGEGSKKHHETLVMRVTVPAHSQSWGVNICPKKHSDFAEILFHFNPRRRFVAMNNREDNIWGQQEKYMLPRWPDMFDVSINVAVQIDRAGFHIAVDGKYCATFAHRTKVPPNGEDLALEVMTADDYGTNLGLVVHEIWWGHKDTMPGLPGAAKERQPARSADPWKAGEKEDTYIDLHVGNLPAMPNAEQQEAVRKRLSDMFQPYGAIQVRVFPRDRKNFGFIKFRDHNNAAKALEELSGAEVQGRTMRLSRAAGR